MGIDPVTHKHYSQIFSDYASFNNNLNPTFEQESNPPSGITGLPYANMILSPTTEQAQVNSFSMNPSSLDFLGQFQVTSQDNLQPYFFNEVTSSCSSSSSSSHATELASPQSYSCQQSQPQIFDPPSLNNWSELFLIHEPFQSTEPQQEKENPTVLLQSDTAQQRKFANGSEYKHGSQACEFGYTIGGERNDGPEASSSSLNSFVDTILDQDREIRAAFPDIFDVSFDY